MPPLPTAVNAVLKPTDFLYICSCINTWQWIYGYCYCIGLRTPFAVCYRNCICCCHRWTHHLFGLVYLLHCPCIGISWRTTTTHRCQCCAEAITDSYIHTLHLRLGNGFTVTTTASVFVQPLLSVGSNCMLLLLLDPPFGWLYLLHCSMHRYSLVCHHFPLLSMWLKPLQIAASAPASTFGNGLTLLQIHCIGLRTAFAVCNRYSVCCCCCLANTRNCCCCPLFHA